MKNELWRKQADGKVENQKQVSHFPTATNPLSPGRKTRAAGGLRPPPGGVASRRPKSQRVVVVDREKLTPDSRLCSYEKGHFYRGKNGDISNEA